MFNIGMTEMIIIGVIALIVLGPSRLPGVARTLGKTLAEFKRATNDFKRTVAQEFDEAAGEDIKEVKDLTKDLKKTNFKPRTVEEYLESTARLVENIDVEDKKERPDLPDSEPSKPHDDKG